MEDLGHYLANYSAAQCMQWGLLQGCGYVKTRCGAGGADRAAVVDAMDECEGRPVWLAIDDPLLAAKCAGGIAPCATVALNGYQSADGVKKCNAQCYTGATPITGAPACTVKPAAAVEGAETSEFMGREISAHWMQYLWIAVWVLGAIFVLGCARVFLCPKEGSKLFMNLTSTIMITAGLALFVVSLIGYLNLAVPYISMVAIEVEALMGVVMLYVIGIVGGVIMLVGLTTLMGICCKSACLLVVMQMFWIVLLLAQVTRSHYHCLPLPLPPPPPPPLSTHPSPCCSRRSPSPSSSSTGCRRSTTSRPTRSPTCRASETASTRASSAPTR